MGVSPKLGNGVKQNIFICRNEGKFMMTWFAMCGPYPGMINVMKARRWRLS
jgi:hypothetical protein